MAKSDRLFRLLHAIRTLPSPVTAARLAEETDVSIRSLYRDIDSLRAAGARIEGERGYGYRLVEDPALPPQTFDRAELEAISLGLTEVQHFGDPLLADASRAALAKIAAILPTDGEQQLFHAISQVYRPEPRYRTQFDVAAIRYACWQERALVIRYEDRNDRLTDRMILPLAIMYTSDTMTLLAWCCLREAFRMFRLDRVRRVTASARSFRPRRAALLRQYLQTLRQGKSDGLPGG